MKLPRAGPCAPTVADVPCGQRQVLAARFKVVGGREAYPGQYPWAASVQMNGRHVCGASIVSSRYVVTASHCLHGRPQPSLSVVVGEHTLSKQESSEQRLPVVRTFPHEKYRYPSFKNDIAVLELGGEVIGLCSEWKRGKQADVLQRVHVPLVAPATCSGWFSEAGRRVHIGRGQICAGFKAGGKDGCQGDSGGPLVTDEGGHHTLVGVVSAGIGCARPNLPGIYTDVHLFTEWIVSKTRASRGGRGDRRS
ncbi:Trypsin-1 [Amphibalanus amphitrite]|uniref:Trypsin-1 n=1 Tax=Amphibalanus amphitrite TaxID=1232801 RepID=A0A6A4WP26_AMPAM|nr:Trypsin-1 [Amphibalanus amphitrite]